MYHKHVQTVSQRVKHTLGVQVIVEGHLTVLQNHSGEYSTRSSLYRRTNKRHDVWSLYTPRCVKTAVLRYCIIYSEFVHLKHVISLVCNTMWKMN